jgi:hypothetical protein
LQAYEERLELRRMRIRGSGERQREMKKERKRERKEGRKKERKEGRKKEREKGRKEERKEERNNNNQRWNLRVCDLPLLQKAALDANLVQVVLRGRTPGFERHDCRADTSE